MKAAMTGGCLCGAVRYDIAGSPAMQGVCHCRNCQVQAGSAFSMIVGVTETALTITGTTKTYLDQGDSGNAVHRAFCGNCGSPLFSRICGMPDMVFIKAGTLDDTSSFSPTFQVWAKSRQRWVDLGNLPSFQTNPQ
ncbi:GFA family protein [Novosphingobium sp. SL115]|uniref:GFA family protein n=1 Tax=Novosphingobium sp. SL115 TaxID=2995150 RepID=UPI002274BFC9|nr:GFA family protein [Novosphingobium sp. SL115]MCY1671825.1 GFA family protein [Novosphingobium sp. SL115]